MKPIKISLRNPINNLSSFTIIFTLFLILFIFSIIINPAILVDAMNNILLFMSNNQILSAVLAGIFVHYIWKHIETEHKRYNEIVVLERLFMNNYNFLLNNKHLIDENFESKHLVLNNLLFRKLEVANKETLLRIKYLRFLNGILDPVMKFEVYNDVVQEYRIFSKNLRDKFQNEIEKAPENIEQYLEITQEVCIKQLEIIQKLNIELIDKCRKAYSQASTLALEDVPLTVRIATFTIALNKRGKEILNQNRIKAVENLLKYQADNCGLSIYDNKNELCNKCTIIKDCKNYYKLKL